MRKSVAIAVLLAAIVGGLPAEAQRVQRIAAIVNDDIVSVFDLQARMRIVISSAGLHPSLQLQRRIAGQILRRLVDERLQSQEAKRRNISVTKRNMARAVAEIEKRNKVPPGGFDRFLARSGISKEAALAQIRAQIVWSKLIRRVLMPRVSVGEDEIEEELRRLKARRGEMEYKISEILLTVDNPDRKAETRRTAERLVEELRKGANFEALAREFSRGAAASVGGDLGWMSKSELADDLRPVVTRMEPGQLAGPVETLTGVHILRLQRKRRILGASDDKTIVDLHQLLLALPPKAGPRDVAAQAELAGQIAQTVRGCDDLSRAAAEAGSAQPTKLGKMRLTDLSATVRGAIEGLSIGKPSRPVRLPSGVAVFMVCSRTAPQSELPSRKQIAERLRRERIDVLSRRYMRDLRSAAVVDVRI